MCLVFAHNPHKDFPPTFKALVGGFLQSPFQTRGWRSVVFSFRGKLQAKFVPNVIEIGAENNALGVELGAKLRVIP